MTSSCVHHLVEAQVERTPHATAVRWIGPSSPEELTYAELDTKANQLADRLRSAGVGPDVLVGICVDRSPNMLVALLAVLKAGGAYVPFDPDFPRARLAFMLEDARPRILLTLRRLIDRLPSSKTAVLCLDGEETVGGSAGTPKAAATGENLAYVIYTSGSTGKPKGVEIEHRSVVNFLLSMQVSPGIGPRDKLLAVTTLGFDIAGLELFLPLTVGASVEIVRRRVAMDGAALLACLEASGATLMQATPTTWSLLVAAGWKGSKDLKILCGGEPLRRELASELVGKCSSLWNMYGPTETTIWSTTERVSATDTGPISIGRPIANTQVHVLDAALEPVPVGSPGELFIGGDGLARGYLGLPELTAERFIEDPFRKVPGARLYRTGDVVRMLPDMRLVHLGRTDDQVKIRGYRIELGEIEAILAQHSTLASAIVVAREDASGEKSLVACVIPAASKVVEHAVLRGFLAERLPEYMRPVAFVTVDAFPLTPNGKVDRKALAASATTAAEPAPPGADGAVRTPIEETIARVWAEVLGVEGVGPNDDFFALGGNAVLLTKAYARLRDELAGRAFSFTDLVEQATVSKLAAFVGSDAREPSLLARSGAKPRTPAGETPPDGGFRRTWQRMEAGARLPFRRGSSLIISDRLGLGEALAKRLRGLGERVVVVAEGSELERLATDLVEGGGVDRVFHLAAYDDDDGPKTDLAALVQALAESQGTAHPVRLCVVSSNTVAASPNAPIADEETTLSALVQSLTHELRALTPIHVDLAVDAPEKNADRLIGELQRARGEAEVAYRAGRRLVPVLSRIDPREQPLQLQKLCAYVSGAGGALPRGLEDIDVYDRSGRRTCCRWVAVDAIPRTADGTVDRERLAALAEKESLAPNGRADVALAADTQSLLEQVFADALGVRGIERADDFFENGGSSLMVMRIMAVVRRLFSVDLTARAFFESTTLEALVARVDEAAQRGRSPDHESRGVPAPKELEPRRGAPLSLEQELFYRQHAQGEPTFQWVVLALHGPLDRRVLEESLLEIVRRNDIFRSTFPVIDRAPTQVVSTQPHTYVSQSSLEGLRGGARDDRIRETFFELKKSVTDIVNGPCFRAAILRLEPEEHRLILMWHHIIWDGVSTTILLRELAETYATLKSGRQLAKGSAPQYRDVARLQAPRLEASLAYHRRHIPETPERCWPAIPLSGAPLLEAVLSLPEPLTRSLESLSKGIPTTLSITLLAALKALLSRHAETVIVSVVHVDRTDAPVVMGPIMTMLPTRTEEVSRVSFAELLRRVRDTTLDAMQHPVAAVHMSRLFPAGHPNEVTFNWIPEVKQDGVWADGVAVEGVEVEPFEAQNRWGDLHLSVQARRVGDRFRITFQSSVFDQASIERLISQYQAFLEEAVLAPERLVSTLCSRLPPPDMCQR